MSTTRASLLRLFVASFVLLFLELACIRWFGSVVPFLAYFANLVLLACFLGMSAGCLAADRARNLLPSALPVCVVAVGLSLAVQWAHHRFGTILIDVGSQQSPQQVFFGAEYKARNPGQFVVPIEVVAGVFFLLVALAFVGLGQELGRAFRGAGRPVAAYSVNILGSLAGIVGFSAASYARTPPVVWFVIAGVLVLTLLPRRALLIQAIAFALLLGLVAVGDSAGDEGGQVTWSPYYRLTYKPRTGGISANDISHQVMVDVEQTGSAYHLPFLLVRDAGAPAFRDALIIGAGSGNDLAAALHSGIEHIDAVDIEPVIIDLGQAHHPNHPYSDPRAVAHQADGRSFLRRVNKTYDYISYALPDSLMLHSSYSSLRLESFLYTKEAFADTRARLRPGGIFAMYNVYRQWWVAARVAALAREAFGVEPLVISMPYRATIGPDQPSAMGTTMVLVSNGPSQRLEAIRKRLEGPGAFWISQRPEQSMQANGYREAGEIAGWNRIDVARVETDGLGRLPSDDWPFLYLRAPMIPDLNLRGMAIVAGLSALVLSGAVPKKKYRPSASMFLLGAGFMLLETRATVQMALLFGATWVVSSIVIGSILVMILLSNLTVLVFRPRNLRAFYILLLISIGLNLFITPSMFLGFAESVKLVLGCGLAFLPIYFAGIVFAVSFARTRQADVDLGSNVAGSILGGLCENFSLVLGFKNLLWVAAGFYGLSALMKRSES